MKKTLYILFLALFAISAFSRTMLNTFSNDSLYAFSVDSIVGDSLKNTNSAYVDSTFFFIDQALAWLDTTNCSSDTLIVDLPDSIYKVRLQELPFIIEVPYNHIVRGYITRYLRSPRRLASLSRMSEYYFPIFCDMLAKNDLPYELCYLPVIESALNPNARSHMGAAGLWQFMPSTGRNYGLEINSLVDERMDPIRSTDAACRFLKSLYKIFGDWTLSIAAYNCGPGNVNKAIHRAGGKKDFWSIYPFLPHETRCYVPIYIAATYAMNYAEDHGICPALTGLTMITDTIRTAERIHLKQIAEVIDIPIEELRRLNPQYSMDILPGGKSYALCLPIDKSGLFIDQQDSIRSYQANELINNRRAEIDLAQKTGYNGSYHSNGATYYKIKNGDTLSGIAKKFHCSIKQLKAWNGLKSDNIRAGKTLRVG